jgi:hypothetical protein
MIYLISNMALRSLCKNSQNVSRETIYPTRGDIVISLYLPRPNHKLSYQIYNSGVSGVLAISSI